MVVAIPWGTCWVLKLCVLLLVIGSGMPSNSRGDVVLAVEDIVCVTDGSLKKECSQLQVGTVKREGSVIDLDDEIEVVNMPRRRKPDAAKQEVMKQESAKRERVKRETVKREHVKREKVEPKKKKAKVKKEKPEDGTGRHGDPKSKGDKESRRKRRSRSAGRAKKDGKGRSSSSSSSTSSSSGDPYEKFRPYTKVTLVNLVRKAELNGKTGSIVHPSCAVSPCPPGCLLVRLDTGREIAVKPANVQIAQAFHMAPPRMTQAERLQQVLMQIRHNVDNVMERTHASRAGGATILDDQSDVQGGIGHMV